jgi:outer membrane protein OmpA-like peptidoglycan-associated protein
VRQFPFVKLARCDVEDVGVYAIQTADGEKQLTGRIVAAHYEVADPRRQPPKFFVHDNFANAFQAIGATLVSDPADLHHVTATRPIPGGEEWYLYEEAAGTDLDTTAYNLVAVQVGGPPPATCKLEIYGVNFDFDKATLRPESEPVLARVLGIFNADPGYAAEIGGHTDNVGSRPYNMKLSAQRAEAVKAWLVGHGVAASRLTTAGYADTQPIVPNTTDENRFRNRRVELKRKTCKG